MKFEDGLKLKVGQTIQTKNGKSITIKEIKVIDPKSPDLQRLALGLGFKTHRFVWIIDTSGSTHIHSDLAD